MLESGGRLLPALARQDRGESIAHIRGMLEALGKPWSPGADTPIADVQAASNPDMLGGILRELEESGDYAFLRGDEEFTALLAAHRKKA